jgi:hypothetical protein
VPFPFSNPPIFWQRHFIAYLADIGTRTACESTTHPAPGPIGSIAVAADGFLRMVLAVRRGVNNIAFGMEESATIQCPYCGQSFELVVDTTLAEQRFTTDCEICCRPFDVVVRCEAGDILSVEVQ